MQGASSTYELGRADYAWALTELEDPAMNRGVTAAADAVGRWGFRLFLWGPAALALVAMAVVTVFAAIRFGITSPVTLVALVLVPVLPCLWIVGAWLWEKWEMLGVGGSPVKDIRGALLKKIDRGEAPLPLGNVEVTWDLDALLVSGGGKTVDVPWSARPTVRRDGDRVLVMPFIPTLGAPDVGRLAIVRAEGFPDGIAFEQAVEAWSSRARG